jgi:hypothetical protein
MKPVLVDPGEAAECDSLSRPGLGGLLTWLLGFLCCTRPNAPGLCAHMCAYQCTLYVSQLWGGGAAL